jgi:hypothetical protein
VLFEGLQEVVNQGVSAGYPETASGHPVLQFTNKMAGDLQRTLRRNVPTQNEKA